MDATLVSLAIGFVVGVWVGRSSLRSRASSLEVQLQKAQEEADENFNDYSELVAEYNDLVDDYNEAIRPKSKPKPKPSGSQAKVTSNNEADASASPKSPPKTDLLTSAPKTGGAYAPVTPTAPPPKIVTRTASLPPGVRAIDGWSEKTDWFAADDAALKNLINQGQSVASVAIALGLDQKDVAYRATRLFFDEWGELDDKAKAPFDGTNWTQSQKMQFDELVAAKRPLAELAKRLGRTKIAIGWRMIDNRRMHF